MLISARWVTWRCRRRLRTTRDSQLRAQLLDRLACWYEDRPGRRRPVSLGTSGVVPATPELWRTHVAQLLKILAGVERSRSLGCAYRPTGHLWEVPVLDLLEQLVVQPDRDHELRAGLCEFWGAFVGADAARVVAVLPSPSSPRRPRTRPWSTRAVPSDGPEALPGRSTDG
ncbi:MAG: hypothetical protein ACR2GH_16855 [Pseudonocardia sp.]